MQSVSATETPSGILGICKISTGNQSDDKLDDNWLYLDNISDPGNMGTLLRTAVWFGIHNIAFSRGCVDIFNPKVVRSGMGAHFHISYILDANITQFNSTHTLYGGDQDGKSLDDFDIETPWILVLGNEAHGISQGIRKTIHRYIAIPRLGAGESLNVAVAGGIIMEKLVKK
jgi:TrmH family RNA methyltransferase